MNTNKIYFIQAQGLGRRQCFIVSSPTMGDAIVEVQDHWLAEGMEVIQTERVRDMVDTDECLDGKTYIKIHN